MTLQDCYKGLDKEEDLYLLWPYQWEALDDIRGAIEELARLAKGTGENQLEDTLGIIAHRFGNILETMDERIPRSQVEKGGDE